MSTSALMDTESELYAASALLLSYPRQPWLAELSQIRAALPPSRAQQLAPLLDWLEQGGDLIELQERYVETFDSRPSHSLHLFEHIHGQSRDRGPAMVDLRQEYLAHGLEPDPAELPDYVPLFLEFLARIPAAEARRLLGDAVHVLARLADKLAQAGSPYACVFELLCSLSDVAAQPLAEPAEGEFEESPVEFGPQAGGPQAMLRQMNGQPQPVQIYARDPRRQEGRPDSGFRSEGEHHG